MATAVGDLERSAQRPVLRVVPRAPTPTPRYWLRRLVALCILLAILGAAVMVVRSLNARPAPRAPRQDLVVVLGPGETVWDLARRYQPDGHETSAWVSEVVRHNRVDARALAPGTPVRVPVAVARLRAVDADGS